MHAVLICTVLCIQYARWKRLNNTNDDCHPVLFHYYPSNIGQQFCLAQETSMWNITITSY